MRGVVVGFALLAGCGFARELAPDAGSNPTIDSAIQATPDGCTSFSTQLDTCTLPAADALDLSGDLVFDTGTATLTDSAAGAITVHALPRTVGGVNTMVLVTGNLALAANTHLRVNGPIPLVIVARGTISFGAGAVIDATDGGAGARTACTPTPAVAGQDVGGGGGGGGGGGFGALGGQGGTGNSDRNNGGTSAGGLGGAATLAPTAPTGGCPGAKGGDGSDNGGAGGKAGGAIDLIASGTITMLDNAAVNVGGGGGRGGTQGGVSYGDAGGGGGGSGGSIIIEAPMITGTGALFANGGAGGQGSGNFNSGAAGAVGQRSTNAATCTPSGSSSGTTGADGGAMTVMAGGSVIPTTDGGGGGGGGSVGFIVIHALVITVATSPTHT